MLSGKMGSYVGSGISSAGGWLDDSKSRMAPIGQVGKGIRLGIGAISREELLQQMAARRFSEEALHRASVAAWRTDRLWSMGSRLLGFGGDPVMVGNVSRVTENKPRFLEAHYIENRKPSACVPRRPFRGGEGAR